MGHIPPKHQRKPQAWLSFLLPYRPPARQELKLSVTCLFRFRVGWSVSDGRSCRRADLRAGGVRETEDK